MKNRTEVAPVHCTRSYLRVRQWIRKCMRILRSKIEHGRFLSFLKRRACVRVIGLILFLTVQNANSALSEGKRSRTYIFSFASSTFYLFIILFSCVCVGGGGAGRRGEGWLGRVASYIWRSMDVVWCVPNGPLFHAAKYMISPFFSAKSI